MAKTKKTDAQVIIDALPLLDLSELLAVVRVSTGLISEHEKKAKADLELIQNGGK